MPLKQILSDECVSTKLGATENFVSSLYLFHIYIIYIYISRTIKDDASILCYSEFRA